ncbi:UBN2 domain-containing protein, partial [Cephalotus follicularis]
ILKSPI